MESRIDRLVDVRRQTLSRGRLVMAHGDDGSMFTAHWPGGDLSDSSAPLVKGFVRTVLGIHVWLC